MDDSNSALDVDGEGNVTNPVEEKASTEAADVKKKSESSHSKVGWKVWTLFGTAVVAVVSLAGFLIAVIITNNQGGGGGEKPEITEPVIMEYTGLEIDDEINEIAYEVHNMSADEAFAYLDKAINKYKGTNMWPKLVMLKAQTYMGEEELDKALETALKIKEEEVENKYKFDYYNLMSKIYHAKHDAEKEKEYTDKFWAFYDGEFGTEGVTDEDEIDEVFITQPEGAGGDYAEE